MPSTQEIQRALTVWFISPRRLNVPAIWLDQAGTEEARRGSDTLNTDLLLWGDDRNCGVRLVDGFIELQIKAPDDVFAGHLFKACGELRVDARGAFGSGRLSNILLRVDDPESIDKWANLWPRGYKDRAGNWVETGFTTSSLPTPKAKPIWRNSSPLPGSSSAGELVSWRPNGKPPALTVEQGIEDLEPRAIAPTTMETIVRAIAFATLSYWVEVYLDGLEDWDASFVGVMGDWIARLVVEGRAINAPGKSIEGVCWSPVDSPETALSLIGYLRGPPELTAAYERATRELERDPTSIKVAGWSAIETRFGVQAKIGIRRAFRAGLDLDIIERMAEQYIFDSSDHIYIDRDALLKGLPHEQKYDDLCRQYDNATVFVGGKPKNPFRLYAASSLRTDVSRREFFPGREAGSIIRFSRVYGVLKGDDRRPDDYGLLNTFSGFAIKPTATIDPVIMKQAITAVDRMLGLLTQDNDDQILYLKKTVAHIAQKPAEKAQACPVIIGGQGIGKSVFGIDFMNALFREMAGSADASALSDNKFVIEPFIGKIITFVDEVRLESTGSVNTIKKLVRSDSVSGQVKFGHQRDYYIPSRLLIASNSPDIGLSPADAADRAFFFIVSYTAENKRLTDREFQTWAVSLKPFYSSFLTALKNVVFRQHLMRYFMDLEVNRAELENLEFSSRNDESVVRSTMPKAREVARQIAAEGHIMWSSDITAWFNITQLRDAIKRVEGPRGRVEASQVVMEYERAGVIELMSGGQYKFKYAYGKLCQKLSEAHNLELHPIWPKGPGDYEDNPVLSGFGAPPWRGLKHGQRREERRETQMEPDPDYIPNF